MKIHKQVPSLYGTGNYKITPLKTKNSNRDLPNTNILIRDLKNYMIDKVIILILL